MTWGFIIAIIFLLMFIFALLTLGEGLLKVAATQNGVEASDYSVMPNSLESILGKDSAKKKYVSGPIHRLDKGYDIKLSGSAVPSNNVESVRLSRYIIKPTDILGMSPIPKVIPEVGAQLKAGDPLFYDKKNPDVVFVAPISGELIEINRGEKRKIIELVILADQGEIQYHQHSSPSIENATREEIVQFLLSSGAWPFIRQRPFDTIASPSDTPKSIFVSTFDSAPLAPDLNLAVVGNESAFHNGLKVLTRLTSNNVNLGLSARTLTGPSNAYIQAANLENVKIHWFDGPHPSGNVGVQMHHIDPVLPGSLVWHTDVHAVILIGKLFEKGIFDSERVVAITGAELNQPRYVKLHQGACVDQLLSDLGDDFVDTMIWVRDEKGNKTQQSGKQRSIRIISGDVLSGCQIERNGAIGYYDDQITVVKEGNYYEMLGWLVPQTAHPTRSKTFPSAFFNDLEFVADTNTNGEKRAFVMTGEYEDVLPMDIYPQHLFRSIMANDIEKMEGLGILELGEEDVALCEYVCTSKQPLQKILREGLETLRNS